MTVETGLDRLANGDPEVVRLVRGRRVGLVAHPASVTRSLVHARRVVESAGGELVALFGPEHGLEGEAQDMIHVAGEVRRAGPAVHSLYGATEAELSPRAEWLRGLDAILVDLQDVGSRYYTFVWTAVLVLEAAAAVGVSTIVLDRPNPLGGEVVEGMPQRPGYRSFVGLRDVSVRHGLTIGEIVTRARREASLPEDALTVVPMRGYRRAMYFDETGLPWVLPSPNMPTLDTAIVYPGGCLVEGTRLSEGRGTTRPFEIWGAPHLDGQQLAARVALEGAVLRPLSFEPTFQKHARTRCGGVQVHVTDRTRFRSYEGYLRLIAAAVALAPEAPRWRTEEYEYVTDRPAIDLLTGGPEYRSLVDSASALDDYLEAERRGAAAFAEARRHDLLYA